MNSNCFATHGMNCFYYFLIDFSYKDHLSNFHSLLIGYTEPCYEISLYSKFL